jgi:hypothetical protein
MRAWTSISQTRLTRCQDKKCRMNALKNFPQIAKWINFCYKTPPILRINVENSLHGESGTSQGDPCAPFAFALVLHKLLLRKL